MVLLRSCGQLQYQWQLKRSCRFIGSWCGRCKDRHDNACQPPISFKYREEYYFNNAEDQAEIIATGQMVTMPFGNSMKELGEEKLIKEAVCIYE